MPPVFGRQFIDAGNQEVPLLIARALPLSGDLVVVVQAGGLGGGGADGGDRHVQALGQRVDGQAAAARARFRVVARV